MPACASSARATAISCAPAPREGLLSKASSTALSAVSGPWVRRALVLSLTAKSALAPPRRGRMGSLSPAVFSTSA